MSHVKQEGVSAKIGDGACRRSSPRAFDDMGFPFAEQGSSTVIPGLHFMGVPFQRNRRSANLLGVGEDATVLAERMLTFPISA